MAIFLAVGCGGEGGEETEMSEDTSSSETTATANQQEVSEGPETVADLFPEGEGRIMVLNNCSSCHDVACAAMGQRPEARWNSLKEAHREHVPSLSEGEMDTIFAYLQNNFGPDQPEPEVPDRFLRQGCTPF